VKIEIIREQDAAHNWGQMWIDGVYFGETLEDKDRFLESGGVKINGDTAIPRGVYRVTLSMSNRFRRVMPEVHDVPGFAGVRIHGGNVEADTAGCPLLGVVRTATGVANCHGINERLIDRIGEAIADKENVTLEVT
jgi:hypothetical protein